VFLGNRVLQLLYCVVTIHGACIIIIIIIITSSSIIIVLYLVISMLL